MFELTDLRLGMKVLCLDTYTKTFNEATIIELSLNKSYIVVECKEEKKTLQLSYYKLNLNDWTCSKSLWCFPNAVNYINHIKKRLQQKSTPPTKKPVFPDYDKYNHDNNKNQIELKLKKQRAFITKIMEQGYVWYATHRTFVSGTNWRCDRVWEKEDNPIIEFKNNNYFILTPCGNTCAKKEGRTLSLTNPEEK